MKENKSEVAAIKAQIEAEYHAAQQGISGLAEGTARHQFITARLERIAALQEALEPLVGQTKAVEIIAEIAEKEVKDASNQ